MILDFLKNSTTPWHSSIDLISKYGKDALNKLYTDGLIEVREGINFKVIKLK